MLLIRSFFLQGLPSGTKVKDLLRDPGFLPLRSSQYIRQEHLFDVSAVNSPLAWVWKSRATLGSCSLSGSKRVRQLDLRHFFSLVKMRLWFLSVRLVRPCFGLQQQEVVDVKPKSWTCWEDAGCVGQGNLVTTNSSSLGFCSSVSPKPICQAGESVGKVVASVFWDSVSAMIGYLENGENY